MVLHADKNTQEAQFVKISDFRPSEKQEKRIVSVNKCYQRLYKYIYSYVKMRKIMHHRDLYGFGGRCVNICMDFESCFKVCNCLGLCLP